MKLSVLLPLCWFALLVIAAILVGTAVSLLP
jgi:hypothetical protein